MKINITWVLLAASLIFYSGCTPPITFYRPQPKDVRSSTHFKRKHIGEYRYVIESAPRYFADKMYLVKAMSDSLDSLPQVFSSEKLTVHQASIVAHKSYMGLLSKSDLDSLLQDIAHLDQASLEITERNDTIIVRYQYVDTIFKMSENQILKKYKGHYYLNKKRDGEWEVLQISIRNGLLKLKSIEDSDAKLIGEISRYYRYRTNNIDPTKKTFTTFVKQGGFHGQKNYLKEKK